MAKKEPGANNTATKPKSKGGLSPDEPIWKRYSKHHEFPLSTASSILLHAFAFVILIVGWVMFFRSDPSKNKVEIGAVVLAGGGGGLPDGSDEKVAGLDE